MKKIVFTLALFLMSLGAAMAQTWDFKEGVGTVDLENLAADVTGTSPLWTVEDTDDNFRYKSKGNLTSAALTANGKELYFTKGLLFTTTKDDAVRVDVKKNRLALNAVSTVTVKGVKQGFIVKVSCQTSKAATARALTATNVTPATDDDFNTAGSKELKTYTGTVTAEGDITFSNSGGLYVYSISITDPSDVNPDDPDAFHNVSATKLKNQMVLTVDGEPKYYNTSDVKATVNNTSGLFTVSSKTNDWSDLYPANVTNVSFVKAQIDKEDGTIDNSDNAKISLKAAQSWFESAFVEWLPYEGATSYNVYVKGGQYSDFTKIDEQLVRDYGTYCRADAMGLKADTYELKVVPVVNDAEVTDAANTAADLKVRAHDRTGFAFNTSKTPGAYNADGTLKANAQIIYITDANKDNVTCAVNVNGANKDMTEYKGLQGILTGLKKGNETRPFVFRIIGNVGIPSTADKGDILIDMNRKDACAGITIEGVGNDAVANGWGIRLKGARYAEVANIGFMNCSSNEGDNIGLQQDNEHIWVHNCDMFYGNAGSDADQAKGDGALDCKKSNYVTLSYNHFWDNGKCNLLGLSEKQYDLYITYHHNWYDHSDSRHPRIRFYSAHVYNNYYDGNAKYGVGSTLGSSVFVENNYFRNTNKPMMISQQGTDIASDPKGTFSGEAGGIIKAYGNVFVDMTKLRFVPYSENNTEFDAYVASTRDEQVPETVTSKLGGNKYNNFDTSSSIMYAYTPDQAEDVPAVVAGQFGAGRMQHGDFQWSFNNSVDDASYDINADLKKAVSNYKGSLVKVFGEVNGAVDGGSGDTGDGGSGDSGSGDTGDGGSGDGGTVTPIEGTVLVTFTGSKPSSDIVSVSGSYSTKKGTATIDGTAYTTCVKMESKTSISLTLDKNVTATFYFADGETASMVLDGNKITATGSTYTTTLESGSHTIAKDKSVNLFGIKLVPVTE